jgi:hypothetical protein
MNSTGIAIDSVFGGKFTANVNTVFYQRKGDEDSIYYFKDGKYVIAKYSEEVVIRIDKKYYNHKN